MFAARKRGSAALAAEDGNPDLGQCGGRLDEERSRSSLGCRRRTRRSASNGAVSCGLTTSGSDPTGRNTWSRC